ncbi:MAG: TraR/DksA family transcriptional regulator [Halomonas sp.]
MASHCQSSPSVINPASRPRAMPRERDMACICVSGVTECHYTSFRRPYRVCHALARIGRGEFGECIECGEWISAKRLEWDPTVLKCIDCAE